ncbi:unnamed protein product [Boreogadus saida]
MGRGRTKSTSSLGPVQAQQRALRSRRRESATSSEKQTKRNSPEALPPCPPQPAPPGPAQEPAPTSWAGPGTVKESDGETSGLTRSLKTTTLSEHNPDNREDSMEVEDQTSSTCMDGDRIHDNMDLCGALTEVGGRGGEAEGFEALYPTGRMEEEEDGTEHQRSEPVRSAEDRESGTEPVEGMLWRKRKRMGVCVLTEKERSHFLKKHENEKLQNEAEEKRVGDTGRTGDDGDVKLEEDPDEESHPEAEEGWVVSVLNPPGTRGIKVGPLTEQSELEEEPAPPRGGAGDSSSEAAAREEGSDAVSPTDPVRSEESDPRAATASKDCGRGPLGDREARRPMETTAGRKDEPQKQANGKEAVAEPHRGPSQDPSSVNIDPTESQREEVQTPRQQPTDSSATTGGLSEAQGSQPSHPLVDTGLGRSEPIGTPPGPAAAAAAAPSGGEENGNSGPLEEVDMAASPAPQPLLARAPPDLVGTAASPAPQPLLARGPPDLVGTAASPAPQPLLARGPPDLVGTAASPAPQPLLARGPPDLVGTAASPAPQPLLARGPPDLVGTAASPAPQPLLARAPPDLVGTAASPAPQPLLARGPPDLVDTAASPAPQPLLARAPPDLVGTAASPAPQPLLARAPPDLVGTAASPAPQPLLARGPPDLVGTAASPAPQPLLARGPPDLVGTAASPAPQPLLARGPPDLVGTAASPAPQPLLARGPPDLVGFGAFDYISDSQLQDISLMEAQGGGPPSLEDASAQVRGLAQELSYLNRIVMATQRKVELFRRGNRGPKAH